MKQLIKTNRLIIREFIPEDVQDLYKIESDSRVIKYIPGSRLLNLNECRRLIKMYMNEYNAKEIGSWAVTLNNTSEFIGITELRYLSNLQKIELGTKIIPEFWGKGYSTEIGNAMIHYGLTKLNLDEIIAITDPRNIKSIKSLESLGMKFIKQGYYKGINAAFYHVTK